MRATVWFRTSGRNRCPTRRPWRCRTRKRNIKKVVSDGAKPDAPSRIENARMFHIRVGLRPNRSASLPKTKAPIGPGGQGQEHRFGHVFHIDVERRGDVLEHEHHEEEIERIQCPAEVGGHHDVLLTFCPLHLRTPVPRPILAATGRNCRHSFGRLPFFGCSAETSRCEQTLTINDWALIGGKDAE